MDGDCCRLRDQRHFPDGDGTKLAVNWTDEKRISRHAELGRLVPRDVAAQYFTGPAGSPWLAYVLYPPVLKSGDQVPRWAETELQAMGPLCSREKRMLGLMVGALVLWIFGGDYIDAAMVGYSVVALMLLLRIISWDDIVSNKAAWNVFFWLASLITLATGLNNTGFISWFGKLLAGSLSGYSPTMVMVALIVVFYLLRYFFASATAYTSALAPMMIAAALAMPEIPLPVFCLMVGAAIGLGSILTPYATGPSPIYYGSGYLPTADYWRLGGDFLG